MTPPPVRPGSSLVDPPVHLRRSVVVAVATVVGLVMVGLLLRLTELDAAGSAAVHHLRGGPLGPVAEVLYLALKPLPATLTMLAATAAVAGLTRSWRPAAVVIEGVHYLGDAAASLVWVAGVFPAVRGGWAMAVARMDATLRRRRSHRVV